MVTTVKPPEESRIIQGQLAGSTQEWYVAKALWRLDHEFEYQVPYFGGSIRGGQILDFLVKTTVPLPTPIQVFGSYWHKGQMGSEDAFKLAVLEDSLRSSTNPLIVMWGADLETEEQAYGKVLAEVGRG